MNKATSHRLYYRKFCLGACSQAKLMFIQTGSAKFYFASATTQILNSFQNLLPIGYIIGSCRQTARRDTCQQLMFIQTVMPQFIVELRLAT